MKKKNQELIREHRYLKDKIDNLKNDLNKKTNAEDQFNQDIEELSQETQDLFKELEKWRT